MTRKSIAIEIAMPSGPAHYWKAMMAAGAKGFTIRAIALASDGVSYTTVKRYVWWLEKEVTCVKTGARRDGYALQNVYAVKKRQTKAPIERKGDEPFSARDAMWNAIRTLQQFLRRAELQMSAATEERPISQRSAEHYIQKLVGAGVLLVLQAPARACGKSKTGIPRGATPGRYKLRPSANTGPQAPVPLQSRLRLRHEYPQTPWRDQGHGGAPMSDAVNLNSLPPGKVDFLAKAQEPTATRFPSGSRSSRNLRIRRAAAAAGRRVGIGGSDGHANHQWQLRRQRLDGDRDPRARCADAGGGYLPGARRDHEGSLSGRAEKEFHRHKRRSDLSLSCLPQRLSAFPHQERRRRQWLRPLLSYPMISNALPII